MSSFYRAFKTTEPVYLVRAIWQIISILLTKETPVTM